MGGAVRRPRENNSITDLQRHRIKSASAISEKCGSDGMVDMAASKAAGRKGRTSSSLVFRTIMPILCSGSTRGFDPWGKGSSPLVGAILPNKAGRFRPQFRKLRVAAWPCGSRPLFGAICRLARAEMGPLGKRRPSRKGLRVFDPHSLRQTRRHTQAAEETGLENRKAGDTCASVQI